MDLVIICRDAMANSLLDSLVLAMEAKKAEMEVVVFLTQDALGAVCQGSLAWSPGLVGQRTRLQMAANAATMEIPVTGRGDGKQVDAKQLVGKAKEAGVQMFAWPVWVQLLGLKGKLPAGLAEVDLPTALRTIVEAKRVIGTL